ncbi:hypothetical protein J1N44_18645, partial [Acidovorax temperans]|nr:hypothetical protein [Acidovorax temperans]
MPRQAASLGNREQEDRNYCGQYPREPPRPVQCGEGQRLGDWQPAGAPAGKGDELNSKPIGTGPFVFTRYRKDAQVRYAANPDYWKG